MINFQHATNVIDKHIQIHDNSCAASGYEMLLKIHGLIPEHDYRYQADSKNIGIGFDTITQYKNTNVTIDFHHKNQSILDAFTEIRSELNQDRACLISVHNSISYNTWTKNFQLGSAHIWICIAELQGRVCALTKANRTNTSSPTDIESVLASIYHAFNFYTVDYVTYTIV